jgi:phenylacetic acid degradation operon negative regulatory protein
MAWQSYFHHPDISLPVVRRYLGDELLQLFSQYLQICATRGRSLGWNNSFPNRDAYRSAVYRLKKAGLIAHQRSGDKEHVIELTREGEARLPGALNPQTFWRKKWNEVWYVLMYDVPEERRDYRRTLRDFLQRMRMGQLQKSVFIGPHDIRPQYHDLIHGAGIKQYAHLFEAHTVLGQEPREIVTSAWDFDRLESIQRRYRKVYGENLKRIDSGHVSRGDLEALAREEMAAYLSAMEEDPLLPRRLLPHSYQGRKVFQLHRDITRLITRRLRGRT